jgi:DNA-binding transcriptional LysR family regulator
MTEAASMLYVTQSAVSKIMKEMEDEVGFSLFARRQGGLVPTPEARLLFVEVERMFIGVERVMRAAGRIKARHHGQIKIVAMSALSSALLQHAVREFSKKRPTVRISIETYNSPEVVDLVASGNFELGYAMTPIVNENVLAGEVLRANCVCLLPAGHILSSAERIDVHDLEASSFISLTSGNTTRLKIDSLFSSLNINRNIVIETNWSVAVCVLVSQGLGVSIIDPFTATLATNLSCVARPLLQEIDFSFSELRPRNSAENPLANEFSEIFLELFKPYAI